MFTMRKHQAVLAAAALMTVATAFVAASVQPAPKSAANSMVVYKSATCGCCKGWIAHLNARGFQVEGRDVPDSQLVPIAIQSGVPADLQTCHTAKIAGYIVEGHVPAEDIQRMLKEKPAIVGIGVGGMPIGSPGMEGGTPQHFNTMAFTKDGKETVFAKH
jgi:hypothetical protein